MSLRLVAGDTEYLVRAWIDADPAANIRARETWAARVAAMFARAEASEVNGGAEEQLLAADLARLAQDYLALTHEQRFATMLSSGIALACYREGADCEARDLSDGELQELHRDLTEELDRVSCELRARKIAAA